MPTPKIKWARNFDQIGNALGYSTHSKMLQAALKRNGHNLTEDEDYDIAVHIVTPEMFIPIPEKFNVLYSMYECTTLPHDWVEPLQHPDLIVVPCAQNKMMFSHYTKVPIEVCLEGVEVDKFTYVERTFPTTKRFVWLWVGASNPRKGYQHAITAWGHFNNKHPELADKILLYMKTTQLAGGEHIAGYKDGKPVMEEMPKERVFKAGNVRIDTRMLPFEGDGGLIDMYQKAHAFLFPTMGEGFGLCVDPATRISTSCGIKPMGAIVPGDCVLSKDGKYNRVIAKTQRIVDSMYVVTASGTEPVTVTAEHPFYAMKRGGSPGWFNVTELNRLDYIACPIPAAKYPREMSIDLAERFDRHDDDAVWDASGYSSNVKNSIAQIIKDTGATKKQIEIYREFVRGQRGRLPNKSIYNDISQYPMPVHKTYPRRIAVDKSFAYFAGWYIAEGNGGGSVELSLGSKDSKADVQFLADYLRGMCGMSRIVERELRVGIYGCSRKHGGWVKDMFGKDAFRKRIPGWLLGDELFPHVLKGYILGDGHIRGDCITATTASHSLAYQIRERLLMYGIFTSIRPDKRNHCLIIGWHGKSFYKLWNLIFDEKIEPHKRTGEAVIWADGYVFMPIRRITRLNRRQTVMDIQVEGQSSFVGNGVLLHNTLAEAMSTGLPCIYTPWSGPVDFCSPKEAFPLKFSFAPVHTAEILPDGTKRPKHKSYAAAPSIRSIIRQMERVYYDYENALKRGVKAAARIRDGITWDTSANNFAEIITRHWRDRGNG